ncbi:hypothetical protein ABZ814_13515 [Micromonospora musae]|uniref:hypothetical protein n=1 Tax=Micromonospora musae TaxID=1894970 RepID=UPI0033DFA012
MTFSVRQAIDDADLKPFEFEDADGTLRSIPHMKTLTPRQGVRALYDGQIEEVLAEVAPDVAPLFMDLPAHVVEKLMTAWMEHSDVQMPGGAPGKSAQSSPSSPSTAARSRQTSRSAASRSRR